MYKNTTICYRIYIFCIPMCDDDDEATKFAIRYAPLINRLVTKCAQQQVNKREHGTVFIYIRKNYIFCGAYKC